MKALFAGFSFAVLLAVVAAGQAASKAQPLPGLDATVTKVEHAASASLRDCPPGTNTVNAVTRPGRAVRAGHGRVQGVAGVQAVRR